MLSVVLLDITRRGGGRAQRLLIHNNASAPFLYRRLLNCLVLSLESGIVSFLLLGTTQEKERGPEQYHTDPSQGFVVGCSLVQTPPDLRNSHLDTLILGGQLLTVICLILKR